MKKLIVLLCMFVLVTSVHAQVARYEGGGGSIVKKFMVEGQVTVFETGGKEYEVTLQDISSRKAKFNVNGEETSYLANGEDYRLKDGSMIKARYVSNSFVLMYYYAPGGAIVKIPCEDSDNGINPTVKGYSSGVMYEGTFRPSATDMCTVFDESGQRNVENCIGENCRLTEWQCSDDVLYVDYNVHCPKGCNDGVCTEPEQEVIDVRISRVKALSEVETGSLLEVEVDIENIGNTDAEDLRIETGIPELNILNVAYLNLPVGDETDLGADMRIPDDAEVGEYEIEVKLTKNGVLLDSDEVEVQVEQKVHRPEGELTDLSMPKEITPGNNLPVEVTMKNVGNVDLHNWTIEVSVPSLDLSEVVRIDELGQGLYTRRRVFLEIPETASAGTYAVEARLFDEQQISEDRLIRNFELDTCQDCIDTDVPAEALDLLDINGPQTVSIFGATLNIEPVVVGDRIKLRIS